ncbi:MAG TPA: Mut7-C RNAse domain-containing protein, partial [Spirochaetota bacterium]|nr:Mut7-C RNAse domain-containing protein [Spirochaetota bacterium]
DTNLLKMKSVSRGYAIRSPDPDEQTREVIGRFDLRARIKPFSRCLLCNGSLEAVPKETVSASLDELTRRYYETFFHCTGCGKIYWKGSHFERMGKLIQKLI